MQWTRLVVGSMTVITATLLASCGDQPVQPDSQVVAVAEDVQFKVRGRTPDRTTGCTGCPEDGTYSDALDAVNVALEAEGANIRVFMAEYLTTGQHDAMGQVVFARDVGNKQLSSDFVPNDPRRHAGTNVTYIVDGVDGGTSSGLLVADTEGAIDRAMATWGAETCSDLAMTKNSTTTFDIGVVQAIFGFGGIGAFIPFADVIHAGWLPAGFFDVLAPGGSNFIVGVTFTIIFIDGNGPTDIDSNGKIDTAFGEIYYNDNFAWGIDVPGLAPIDVETVALHEAGHGLSQGHFGRFFGTIANQKLHFAPEAVMNAAVFGTRQTLLGSDIGGHCSNWAQWPNN